MNRLTFLSTLGLACAGLLTTTTDAAACGGCFVPPSESTVVTGHRMVLSVSPEQSVLWDQIRYSGDPAEFSWVLPIKPGARIEVASDALFDVLEAGTQTTVQAPPEGCAVNNGGGSGFGCAASDDALASPTIGGERGSNGVEVVHEGTVGPYDTVTLSAEDPDALRMWLDDNGFELPDSIVPTVDAYVNEGFDFIALKLSPGQGVQAMSPVRVTTPGGGPSLPLRMVAAGVGASVDIVLYVIGEGRYQAGGDFENVSILPNFVSWDFRVDRSDYATVRLSTLNLNEGRTWLTSYARQDPFFSSVNDSLGSVSYSLGDNQGFAGPSAFTLSGAYFLQGAELGDLGELAAGNVATCVSAAEALQGSMGVVTDLCDAEGTCREPEAGEIDRRALECGELDDLAVALTGLHPADTHLTRLEASLPVALLDADLTIEAADDQEAVAHRFTAGVKQNACWDSEPAGIAPLGGSGKRPWLPPGGLVALGMGAAGLLLVTRRRRASLLS